MPSESELAAHYGVSRGTVRQAVSALTAEGLIGSRQGARRVVLASRRSQSFEELRSFAQWARAMGREATGHVVAQEYRPATHEDAVRLQLPVGTQVLHVLRVRGLDGEPVLLERTVYADWISPAVESIEPDCPSVTQRLYDDTGWSRLRRAHHRRGRGSTPRTPSCWGSAAPVRCCGYGG